jgi:hypothetical protein
MTTLPDYRSCVDDAWARQWTSRTRVPAYMLDRAKAEVQAEADALLANQDARQGGVASAGDVDRGCTSSSASSRSSPTSNR